MKTTQIKPEPESIQSRNTTPANPSPKNVAPWQANFTKRLPHRPGEPLSCSSGDAISL